MPTAYLEKLAKKGGHGSLSTLEKKWDEAKKEAGPDKSSDWAYITSIFQNMIGLKGHTIKGNYMSIEIQAASRLLTAGKVTTDDLDFCLGMDKETKEGLKKLNITAKKAKHDGPAGCPQYSLTGDKANIMKWLTTEYGLDKEDAEDCFLK